MWREIILYCLVVESVGGYKIKVSDSKQEDSSGRFKADVRKLVEMCFANNSNPVVISADLLDNNWDRGEIPLVVIDREFKNQITGFLPAYPTYVLPSESLANLKAVVDNLQRSALWNIRSQFLIVGPASRCANPRKILEFMWQRDLPSVFYLCNEKDSTVVFAANPYASYAPAPWVQIDKSGDGDKKMTLFRQKYSKDPEICKSLTFDKTDHLEDAEIKFTQFDHSHKKTRANNRNKADQYLQGALKSTRYINLYQISALMNATPTLDVLLPPNSTELLQQGYTPQLVDKTHDIHDGLALISKVNSKYADVIADYTNEQTYSILTRKTNFLTLFADVSSNVGFVVGTTVLFILFLVVMAMANRDDIRHAVLDVLRLAWSMGLESPLDRLVMKFVFFFGFFFAFLIVPDFQGNVSAILAAPLRRNVETLEDLYENKFHVYYSANVEDDVSNGGLWVTDEDKAYLHPTVEFSVVNCVNEARKNSTVACIFVTPLLREAAIEYENLHVSKEILFKKQLVYLSRKNWPLKSKCDEITLKALEPGLGPTSINGKDLTGRVNLKEMKIRLEKREEYQLFGLEDLLFICYFFVICVGLGFIALVIEIIFKRYSGVAGRFLMGVRD